MGGRTRARIARAWSVVFALTIAGAGVIRTLAQPVEIPAPARSGESLLAAGNAAAAGGDLVTAERFFREAWTDPATRPRAAAALRDVHRLPAFRLPFDQAAVEEASRTLGPAFLRYDTPHFVVLSDCPADWSRSRAALLERTRSEFFRAVDRLGLYPAPHPRKLLCVLINDHEAYRRFGRDLDGLDADWVAGYYSTAGNRVVFYNDASSPVFAAARTRLDQYDQQAVAARGRADEARLQHRDDLARQLLASADDLSAKVRDERLRLARQAVAYSSAKTIHECVHLLSFNTGVQRRDRDYPFWVSEGLATGFETDAPDSAFGPDRPRAAAPDSRRARLSEQARQGLVPALSDLVTITTAPGWDADTADTMYALSQALFGHLYRRQPAALGAYIRALGDEPPGPLSPNRCMRLFVERFGDPDAVQRRLVAELVQSDAR
jgi:hypothetical protein